MQLQDLYTWGQAQGATETMPVLFLGHGSPMNAIEENPFVRSWRNIANTFEKPKAILCISAHWETRGTKVTAMPQPPTIHDFGGFPKALFDVQYPAPGSLTLATEVQHTIEKTKVGLDYEWGLDHGAWSVIKHLYPDADVPVLQLSLDYTQGPQYHYDLAKQLQTLRQKGVLIVGSGNVVHNLRTLAWHTINQPSYGYDWAISANEKVKALAQAGNHAALIKYEKLGTDVQMAVPSPDHYLPLLYVLALQQQHESLSIFNDANVLGSIAMTSFKIG